MSSPCRGTTTGDHLLSWPPDLLSSQADRQTRRDLRGLRALPRVDQVDVRVPKVLQVACGQSCAVGATDGGDLRIKPIDRQSDLVTAPDDLRIVRGRAGVEGQHLILEGREHL